MVEGVEVVGQVGVGIGLVPGPQFVDQCLSGGPHLTAPAGLLDTLTSLIEHGLPSGLTLVLSLLSRLPLSLGLALGFGGPLSLSPLSGQTLSLSLLSRLPLSLSLAFGFGGPLSLQTLLLGGQTLLLGGQALTLTTLALVPLGLGTLTFHTLPLGFGAVTLELRLGRGDPLGLLALGLQPLTLCFCSGQLGLGTLEFHSLGLGPLSGDADAFGLGQRLTFGLLLDR